MANQKSGGYLGDPGVKKILELIIDELDNKQDAMEEVSAERVQEIWNEEMNPKDEAEEPDESEVTE